LPDSKSILLTAERWRLAACDPPKGETPGTAPTAAERRVEWVARVDVDRGRCVRLLPGASVRISPGGGEFLYRHGEEASTEIWSAAPDGSGARRRLSVPIAQFGEYYLQYEWSPDGRSIAYSFAPPRPTKPAAATEKSEKGGAAAATAPSAASTVRVIGSAGDRPPDSEIWLLDAATGKTTELAHAPLNLSNLAWRRDGRALTMAAVGRFDNRSDDVVGEVRSLSIPDGKFEVLVRDAGVQALHPVPSPDGRRIAFGYDPANVTFPMFFNMASVPSGGGSFTQLTRGLFVSSAGVWSPDSRRIYFTVKRGAFTQIFAVGGPDDSKQLTRDAANASAPGVSPDGKRIAWLAQDLFGRMELRVAAADGTGARAVADLAPDVKGLALSAAREITWKSRDGLEIAGFLIEPLERKPGVAPPLLVDVHGGPVGGTSLMGSVLMATPLEWQMWAAKGYVVFAPDYRSSAIYGWDEITKARDRQDANEKDFDDIMSGVDAVLEREKADPSRIVLIGHSYGSALTNWLVTHTHRFRVAVSYEGYTDEAFGYGTGFRVGGNSIAEWLHKGKPWEVPESYRKQSSDEFVKGVATPTMFIHGENGIPKFHSEYLYTAWKKQGVDTALLIYGGEGHVIVQPANQRDLLERVLAWVERYVPGR
jgi:acylaminoacyl-peptidase